MSIPFPPVEERPDPYRWYSIAERTWAGLTIAAVFALPAVLGVPLERVPAGVIALLIVPAAFFLLVRIVAAIADLSGGAR